MQLIEQRLEFVVGDLVGNGAVFCLARSRLARSRLARSRLDRVEQLLELAIGASGLGLRLGDHLRGSRNDWRRIGGSGLGEARKRSQQLG